MNLIEPYRVQKSKRMNFKSQSMPTSDIPLKRRFKCNYVERLSAFQMNFFLFRIRSCQYVYLLIRDLDVAPRN